MRGIQLNPTLLSNATRPLFKNVLHGCEVQTFIAPNPIVPKTNKSIGLRPT